VHVDVKYLPQLPDQDQRTYLFTAIDRATRWAYVEILKDKSATATAAFFFCATGERQPTGTHTFDLVCADNRIEHRLTKPRSP